MLAKRKTDTLHCFSFWSAKEFTELQIILTKKLWLEKNYLTFLFENTDRRTRKDDACRDEINSEFPAVPIGTSVWKMLLTERKFCLGGWLHVSLLLKQHCGKTEKINDIEKETVLMDFSI